MSTYNTVCFIGIGLIAGSMALKMRQLGLAQHYIAVTRKTETAEQAIKLGLVDTATQDLAEGVKNADLVVLATPVRAMGGIARHIAPHLKDGAIITDVGSVKQYVIAEVQPILPQTVSFVAGHPIAGTEYSGPSAAFPSLFEDNWCILTPTADTDSTALATVQQLWLDMGAKVEVMDPLHHDQVLAITSHLPHLIAYNIVGTVTDLEESLKAEIFQFAASGFRDFTRIAASDPVMWRDIFLTNKDAVLEMLGRFSEDLAALQRAIRWGDGDSLENLFTRTREVRRGLVHLGVVKK